MAPVTPARDSDEKYALRKNFTHTSSGSASFQTTQYAFLGSDSLITFRDNADTPPKTQSWYPDFDKLDMAIESFTLSPKPSVTFRLKVMDELCNEARILHGGCLVLLVDDLTTVLLGVMSKPGLFSRFGASKNLSVTFIRPLNHGDEANIVSEMEYFGSRRAVFRAKLYRLGVEGDELCSILENDRAKADPSNLSKT